MPVKGNLTQPETLKKFAHVSFRKFVHNLHCLSISADCGEWINLHKP